MGDYGPQERALLESAAAQLYQEALRDGGLSDGDPRLAGEGRAALDLLVRLGLLQHAEPGRWLPEDPGSAQSRVVAPLSQEGARLLAESAEWARVLGSLAQAWRRSPRAADRGPFSYVHGEAISDLLDSLVADAESELLTAQPQSGRNAQALADGALRDVAALERGVTMRTLYQHSARRNANTRQYVAEVTARGAEVRTLDEFFNRMIVVDRRIAVIPAAEDLRTAVVVREPSVVAYLVDIFERTWERGRPFASRETSQLRGIAAEQRAMTVRMLVEGHSDPVSAKRLGVSPRTYAGYVADLKAEFDAETRFQLGYAMGRRGVSGHEPPAEPVEETDEAPVENPGA